MENTDIRRIILHCSDTWDHQNWGFEHINEWHKERGWGGWKPLDNPGFVVYCGYHYIIRKDGVVEVGRPEHIVGAHCYGKNTGSIGICWVGKEDLNKKQRKSLFEICTVSCAVYGLTADDVYGHSEFSDHKTCPNFHKSFANTFSDMDDFRNQLREYIRNRKPICEGDSQ